MAEKITKSLYGGKINIDFYPNSHRYKLVGEKKYLVSVTGVTGVLDKSRVLIKWAVSTDMAFIKRFLEERAGEKFTGEELAPVLEEAALYHDKQKDEAASFGSKVHDYAERFANYVLNGAEKPEIEPDWPEEVTLGVTAFLDWYNTHDVKFIAMEQMLYSHEMRVVGLADLVAEVDGRKMLIDYKTSKGVYSDHHYQVAGYLKMWNEEFKDNQLEGAAILHFSKADGNFKMVEVDNLKEATEAFEALAKVKHAVKAFDGLMGRY